MGAADPNPYVALKVSIVGGGIAGLATAAALRRAGHSVTVFEQSRFSHEVGAAIHLQPNAARVTKQLGFDHDRAKSVINLHSYNADGATLHQTWSRSLQYIQDEFHTPWYFEHRVDLHDELKRLAFEDGPGTPASLRLGSKVVDVDPQRAAVTLSDGSTHEADLLVGADGVHSRVAKLVTGTESEAQPTGQAAYRFLVPIEDLLDDPETAWLVKDKLPTMNIFPTHDRRIACYPCRNNTLMNFVAIHPDAESKDAVEDWNVSAGLSGLLRAYEGFHPSLQAVLRKAEALNDLKLWKLLTREPQNTWINGRTCIIGDAAHPMLPHSGQGGGQSIEDAGALGVLFSNIGSSSDVSGRLEAFQRMRYRRASAIQILSNAGQDQLSKVQEKARKYVDGDVPGGQREIHEYVFSYYVLAEAEKVLSDCRRREGTAEEQPVMDLKEVPRQSVQVV